MRHICKNVSFYLSLKDPYSDQELETRQKSPYLTKHYLFPIRKSKKLWLKQSQGHTTTLTQPQQGTRRLLVHLWVDLCMCFPKRKHNLNWTWMKAQAKESRFAVKRIGSHLQKPSVVRGATALSENSTSRAPSFVPMLLIYTEHTSYRESCCLSRCHSDLTHSAQPRVKLLINGESTCLHKGLKRKRCHQLQPRWDGPCT